MKVYGQYRHLVDSYLKIPAVENSKLKQIKYEIDRYLQILLDANNFPKFQIFVKSKYKKMKVKTFITC